MMVLRAVVASVRESWPPPGSAPLRVGEVELDQRGEHGQQRQRMQADQRDVEGEAGFAIERGGQRDADLHRVAERRGDGAHARHRGSGRPPAEGAARVDEPSSATSARRRRGAMRCRAARSRCARWCETAAPARRCRTPRPRATRAGSPLPSRPLFATAQPIATTAKMANSLTKTCADMGPQYRRQYRLPGATQAPRFPPMTLALTVPTRPVRRPGARHLRPAQEGAGVPAAALPRELRPVDPRRRRRCPPAARSSSAATAATYNARRSRPS